MIYVLTQTQFNEINNHADWPQGQSFGFQEGTRYLFDDFVLQFWDFDLDPIFQDLYSQDFDTWLAALAADSLSVKEGIKREYAAHETAGHDYWADFRAELAYDYREGNITLSNVIYIEDQLSDVTKYLLTGDWLTAQEKLSAITASGALTQAILDDLTAGISSYITNNY